jgi:hypothetical protein
MKDTGEKISRMGTALRLGLMGPSTKATTLEARNMARVPTLGMMVQPMKVNG